MLLTKTKDYVISVVLKAFLHNNSQKNANYYELAIFIKVILTCHPDLLIPYIKEDHVWINLGG